MVLFVHNVLLQCFYYWLFVCVLAAGKHAQNVKYIVSPYRYKYEENVFAARKLEETFPEDMLGKVALGIFNHHKDQNIVYKLDEEAEEVFKYIHNKFRSNFNMNYAGQ